MSWKEKLYMANYVSNMVVCSKAFYEKYFFDTNPFGDGNVSEYIKTHPYITFNKLYGVNSLNEYENKYGVYMVMDILLKILGII